MRQEETSLECAGQKVQNHCRPAQPDDEEKSAAHEITECDAHKPGTSVRQKFPFNQPRKRIQDQERYNENQKNCKERIPHETRVSTTNRTLKSTTRHRSSAFLPTRGVGWCLLRPLRTPTKRGNPGLICGLRIATCVLALVWRKGGFTPLYGLEGLELLVASMIATAAPAAPPPARRIHSPVRPGALVEPAGT